MHGRMVIAFLILIIQFGCSIPVPLDKDHKDSPPSDQDKLSKGKIGTSSAETKNSQDGSDSNQSLRDLFIAAHNTSSHQSLDQIQLSFESSAGLVQERVDWIRTREELRNVVFVLNNLNLKLPSPIPITFRNCGGKVNAFYSPSEVAITFCNELVQYLFDFKVEPEFTGSRLANLYDLERFKHEMATQISFIVLHEFGHAVIHQLDLATTGSEEDSADQFATLYATSLRKDQAGEFISGGALFFASLGQGFDAQDTHSPAASRAVNAYCALYGSDPAAWTELIHPDLLVEDRAAQCEYEYHRTLTVWTRLLAPHIGKP